MSFGGDREAEVLAMGGDPFFLVDDDEEEDDGEDKISSDGPSMSFMAMAGAINAGAGEKGKVGSKKDVVRFATDGLGPTPTRGEVPPPPVDEEEDDWDGWAVEDAHFD
eukprot:CAMPEP_0197446566 /NCGR_PEP_ID=MMETSP1175-20131217/11491_1 /TAXON_ID=1003142 /ORGANISM="Triceratium dubium, Strain CCMP147" /LENGTH=107 /DNA_ID=CAMNT_0042977709 /DNA_START=1 /DNA_END=324 /DNA_ORIENTATION=+